MSLEDDLKMLSTDDPQIIISEPIRFKEKLGIGERAYALLRMREHLTTFTEAMGIGATVSTAAGSSVVAGTFFAKGGMLASGLSAIGFVPVAATPIGWVLAAGLASGATYIGISRFFERSKDAHLIIIPKYINTPLDVIALALIELMLPLSLKVALVDGEIASQERKAIIDFYHGQWGYSDAFITRLTEETEDKLEAVSFTKLTQSLKSYCEQSPDCDRSAIRNLLVAHLAEIVEADGVIHENEQRLLNHIASLLPEEKEENSIGQSLAAARNTFSSGLEKSATHVKGAAKKAIGGTGNGLKQVSSAVQRASGKVKSIFTTSPHVKDGSGETPIEVSKNSEVNKTQL